MGVMSMGPDRPPALGNDFCRFTSVVRFGIMKVAERGEVEGPERKAGCWLSCEMW